MKNFAELSPPAERIVDAAEELVQHMGFNGFSYEDISQKVGLRKPSLHHHFPTKLELMVVLTQRYSHRFVAKLTEVEAQSKSCEARLQGYARLFMQTFEKDRRLCVCGMLGAEADGLPDEVRTEVRRFFELNAEWLERVIYEGQKSGELRSTQPAAKLASVWLAALEGSMLVARGNPAEGGPDAIASTLLIGWKN
jgi:TetR/AcrR family transcriptional repressor of nem operon